MRLSVAVITLLLSVLLLMNLAASAAPFTLARIHYDGGGDWYSDPSSLPNLLQFIQQETGLAVSEKAATVRLSDPELSRYPYLYLTGHGNVKFSEQEAVRLREYLIGGGFLHVDDNYGLNDSFRREIAKVFPDRELEEIPFEHPVYHTLHDFSNGLPKIHEHDGLPAQGFGILHDGRLVLFYTYQCDLGDGWEDADVHEVPEEKRQQALRFGANLVFYALSGMPKGGFAAE